MKLSRKLLAALITLSLLAVAAVAADLTGSWKWTVEGRNGPVETTAKFLLKDGVLTGTVSGRMGETAIGDASCQDGQVAFTVTREFNGNKFVIKYAGKLDGDTITGTVERPSRDGGAAPKVEWKASRVVSPAI